MQDVCVVIPCYNEELRLRRAELLAFVDAHPWAALCLVNDGSRDDTLAAIEALHQSRPEQILVLNQAQNSGKAAAVRAGVLHLAATNRWSVLGYWDADLSTPLAEIERVLTALRANPDCQLAMGSRVKRLGAQIERRALRHVMGRVFASCASAILGLPVYDSQCGAKLFRTRYVAAMFQEPFLTRWLFDLEILARLRNEVGADAMAMAVEVPLGQWQEVGGSKLGLGAMLPVPLELLKIRAHYNKTKT